VEDRIELWLDGDPALLEAAREHRDYVAGETLAPGMHLPGGESSSPGDDGHRERAEIDGLTLAITLRRLPTG
jgi:hypothetical protein